MNKQKPFLTRFSREPRKDVSVNQADHTQARNVTQPPRPTLITRVSRETTDDN